MLGTRIAEFVEPSGTTLAWLYEISKRKEDREVSLGDTLDVKASIILVIVAFLGATSGTILSSADLGLSIKLLQIVTLISLAVSGLCAFGALWPKDYWMEDFPSEYKSWVAQIEQDREERKFFKPAISVILESDMNTIAERIDKNSGHNKDKSAWLIRSFKSLIPALAGELISLVLLSVGALRIIHLF
jgi:hypothetical protein